MDEVIKYVSFAANILTVLASGIAIYIFMTKKKEISSVFSLLLDYTYQLSLSELKEKLERVSEYSAKDPDQCEMIVNIFHEIIGQIKGNEKLKTHFSQVLQDMEKFVSSKRYSVEPRKRSIVSELRERLRNLNAQNIDGLVGGRDV